MNNPEWIRKKGEYGEVSARKTKMKLSFGEIPQNE